MLVSTKVQLVVTYVCHEQPQRSDADVAMHGFPGDTAQVVVPTKLGVVIVLWKDNSELVKHFKAIERQFVLH